MAVVSIPNPCPMKLDQLTAVEGGFHCTACSKVVVDFTQKTNAEILDYLRSKKGERTCGHFRNDQVKRRNDWPFEMVKFVAALTITFGSMLFVTSCGTTGESDTKRLEDSTKAADSMAKEHEVLTGIILCDPPPIEDSLTSDSVK